MTTTYRVRRGELYAGHRDVLEPLEMLPRDYARSFHDVYTARAAALRFPGAVVEVVR